MKGFEVWAPGAESVALETAGRTHAMSRDADGWWTAADVPAEHGADYGYLVDGEGPFPDPRSRHQPDGVHGLSRVVEHSRFPWTDGAWPGRALPGSVTYELHVGTFTSARTFDAAIERLDHLVELGVDLVEVMPVAAFPGRHGWGYDGVALYAVHEPYGGPDGLKRFVDACHARGLGVVLDVVYNHLGPSGNYLSAFGPYFTHKHHTPWGAAVNLDDADSDEVRRFIIDSALGWLRDYHVDGLRLDAVHALADDRAVHLLTELQIAVEELAAQVGRPLFLVAESDRNDPLTVTPRERGGNGLAAQWADDIHHALHSLLSGERQGYYVDFGSYECLATTLTGAFFHAGTYSTFRGRTHGAPVDRARTPGHAFVTYLQNHDQVGNRATGDRLSASVSPGRMTVGAALVLCSAFSPMLFMGEEWAAATPWQYFTDHTEPELADAVREGRREEFASHGWDRGDIPDPQDTATVETSTLDWAEPAKDPHATMLRWYRDLIALRRAYPDLTDPRLDAVRVEFDADAQWVVMHRGGLRVVANLAVAAQPVPLDSPATGVLLASDTAEPHGAAVLLAAESAAIVTVTS
ncbi:malto-oligosyltrehalose trehalohydrolase [Sporichthya sp.]|uniref:malto-oligosyltrehalose trehalohydrolase n=1 Tax=Sporichthya sp. TaxID=65475 RepID=UPI0017F2BD49|nr:malto-oligosyltrehalose trehalohydrolase [Sporichthya sp.]MBA3743610.1 malto-oligosyltrehalose trehalohydrolase [Sporichthya sp.]